MFWNFFSVENRPFEPSEREGDRYSDVIWLKFLTSESSSILCLFNGCNSALFHSAQIAHSERDIEWIWL